MKILFFLFLLFFQLTGYGIQDNYPFTNEGKKQDFVKLTHELRCLVCQNQTIADSNAPLANDLRGQIYQQLELGQSIEEIRDFMVVRYGDFILYKPPLTVQTFMLWLGPFVLLGLASVWVIIFIRRQRR